MLTRIFRRSRSVSRPRPRFRYRRRQPLPIPAHVERLESRTLLAGNVLVGFVGADLVIRGDAADNAVAVSVVGGDVRVQGLEGTQINGSGDPFVVVAGGTTLNGGLRVDLGGGNDMFLVAPGLTIRGNVTIDGGSGDDSVALESLQIGGRLTIRTGTGDDGVSLDDVTVGAAARIQDQSGDLIVSLTGGSIGGDLLIHSSSGDADVVLDSVSVARNTTVKAVGGQANVVVLGSQFDRLLSVYTGNGHDFLYASENTVGRTARFRLGGGVDSIVVEGANEFGGNVVIDGGAGGNALRLTAANSFNSPPRVQRIDVNSVLQSFVDLRLNDPDQGALSRAAQLTQSVISLIAPPLTIDASANTTIESSDTLLTKNSAFQITGVTDPGAIITIDLDGDGQFNDGMVIAEADGTFVLDVSLLDGPNPIRVRSTSAATGGARTTQVNVHLAEGTIVRFVTPLGSFDVELFDDAAPITVANFLDYLERYGDSSIVHRSIEAFVIQGGGFFIETDGEVQLERVETSPPIPNEFNAAHPNVRGTLSTALIGGDVNSATSQWFINAVDNLFLDQAAHTVFGRVVGGGMQVVDSINELPTYNLNGVFPESALATVPLIDYTPFTVDLVGTVTVQPGSVLVTGTGTQFTSQLRAAQGGAPGSAIRIGNQEFTVAAIIDDTLLTLSTPHSTGATNVTARVNAIPDAASFVLFSEFLLLLEPPAPPLVIDVTANGAIESNGTLLTDVPLFQISGVTEPGATVTISRDGDGQFDDGTVVAEADGTFVIDVSLLSGQNTVLVRSTSAETGGRATTSVSVYLAEGTVVRFDTPLGTFDVELFDDAAPLTVANFLGYFDRYGDASIIHRSVDFAIQGGGFVLGENGELQVNPVPTDPPITNEFNEANSNLRGTLSTALVGGNIHSATSQWFINTVDNPTLDQAGHTVFGRVIGTGLEIVDAINALPTFNLNGVFPGSALATVPLIDFAPFTVDLTGTVSVQPGSVLVAGTGTQFTSQLQASQGGAPGSAIRIGNQVFTVAAIIDNTLLTLSAPHATGATDVTAQIHAVPDAASFVVLGEFQVLLGTQAPPLVIDVSASGAIESSGTLLTSVPLFQISGVTEPGATVTVARDGDGQFDDGMVVAEADGTFVIDVSLLTGQNTLLVRSTSAETGGRATLPVQVYRSEGTVVRFDTLLGTFDVELFNDDAPLTVANFLAYLDRYGDSSIVHRSVDDFVVQGGGFVLDQNGQLQLNAVPTDPPILNEFNPANSNVRGTLSMAHLNGEIDSATSQWFINTADNLFLDDVPHAVFGRVIGTGMDVVDAINALPTFNLNGVFPHSALASVPLVDYTPFTLDLTGTVSVEAGSTLVEGVGTQFTTELREAMGDSPGSSIRIGNQVFTVETILSDTELLLRTAHPTGATDVTAQINEIPDAASFIVFSEISAILEAV